MTPSEFLLPVINRAPKKNGKPQTADILRRMDNPVCKQCHEEYKKKYPTKTFDIECQGIYSEVDFKKTAAKAELSIDEVQDLLDPVHWAAKHIRVVDTDGNIGLFTARDYQVPVLACTAARKVDRMGRGMGKTLLGVIEELHKVTTKKNYQILILCPAKAQAQKWFDDILWQCEQDPGLAESFKNSKQQPYYKLEFMNDSSIAIFTAGSSSGRDAAVIRTQSPRRTRLEEQDYLNEGDYKAVMPFLSRYKNSEFHGSSTPTGARSTFWEMCVKRPVYKEFYAPITMHPDWSPAMEETLRFDAKTDDIFRHEFLAEFGDLLQGVFKSFYIDKARSDYSYKTCRYDPNMKYYMGVDWNGQGTGTRIRIIAYNMNTKKRKMVEALSVAGPQTNTQDSLDKIQDRNRYWHCEGVYIDKGFGNVQDEMLRLIGKNATNPDDKRLMEVKVIDFGAEMVTNKLVPNRGNSKYTEGDEIKRRTKPFMVEGAVMCLENGLFEYSEKDELLDAQLRAYRIKTISQHGFANTYDCGSEGDHDLDATMLALLGIELKYGLSAVSLAMRLVTIAYTGGIGGGPNNSTEAIQRSAEFKQRAAESSQIPSRQVPEKEEDDSPKVVLPGRTSHIVVPGRSRDTHTSRVPSRTIAFRQQTDRGTSRSNAQPPTGYRTPNKANPFDSPYIAPRRGGK